jgi:hypothetical protein
MGFCWLPPPCVFLRASWGLAALVLPEVGRLVDAGEAWEPYRLIDSEGCGGRAGGEVLCGVAGCGPRRGRRCGWYGNDLLRWWRFLLCTKQADLPVADRPGTRERRRPASCESPRGTAGQLNALFCRSAASCGEVNAGASVGPVIGMWCRSGRGGLVVSRVGTGTRGRFGEGFQVDGRRQGSSAAAGESAVGRAVRIR